MEGKASEGALGPVCAPGSGCRGFSVSHESLRAWECIVLPEARAAQRGSGCHGSDCCTWTGSGEQLGPLASLPRSRGVTGGARGASRPLLSTWLSPDASLLRGKVWLIKESQVLKVINDACSTELIASLPFFFNVRFIFLFCLVAIWRAPSEWLAASRVNL